MTERSPDRNDLATFLRQRRARVRPEDVGLRPGRRGAPQPPARGGGGARRVGVTWYTWFEQGRAIACPRPSSTGCDALRLSRAERRHLFVLGGHRPPEIGEPPTGLSRRCSGCSTRW